MNKFVIVACYNLKEENPQGINYDGSVVVLLNPTDPDMVLFFPVPDEQVSAINFVLKHEGDYTEDMGTLGIYKTMVNSLTASGKFLSGIILDAEWDEEKKEDLMSVKLAISNDEGMLDGFAKVNFLHAIFVSMIEQVELLVSDKMLERLLPSAEEDEEGNEKGFSKKEKDKGKSAYPEDPNLVNIVKQIMSGKIKE